MKERRRHKVLNLSTLKGSCCTAESTDFFPSIGGSCLIDGDLAPSNGDKSVCTSCINLIQTVESKKHNIHCTKQRLIRNRLLMHIFVYKYLTSSLVLHLFSDFRDIYQRNGIITSPEHELLMPSCARPVKAILASCCEFSVKVHS